MSSRILLVDDDAAVLSALRRAFTLEGYQVLVAEEGETALQMAEEWAPDLVVLDVLLPGLDGMTVCRRLRGSTSIPILMLTARDTVPDRVMGLDLGADDYLVKPFALDELLARCRALLRRAHPQDRATLAFSDLEVDPFAREASRASRRLDLTPHQYELLVVFLRHPRQVLTRDQLCLHVWGHSFDGESNFVDVAVMELRRKLEAGGQSRLIRTVRGVGYALREG